MFKSKSVDSIVAVFTKAIQDLNTLANDNHAANDDAHNQIAKLKDEVKVRNTEIERANSVCEKLQTLIAI